MLVKEYCDTCFIGVTCTWTAIFCFNVLCQSSSVIVTFFTGLNKHIFERIIVNIFLPTSFKICFGCSSESSYWDSSFEMRRFF